MEEEKVGKQISLKAKIAVLLICPIVVIAICSVVIVITVGTLVDGDKYTFETAEAEVLTAPEGNEAIGLAFDKLVKEASAAPDVRVEKGVDVSISDIDGNITDRQKSLLEYFASAICDSVKGSFDTEAVEYGGNAGCVNPGDVASFVSEASATVNDEGTKISYEIGVVPGENAFTARFIETDDKAAEDAKGKSTSACTIKDIKSENIAATVYGESDAEGRLSNISVERKYKVEADVEFLEDLSGLGSQHITFTCTIKERKSIKYAGISIKQDKISLKNNGYDTLSLSANIAEEAGEDDFTIEFKSSDTGVVKVDPNGMIEAVSESKEPVTVTAVLTYLGNTYSDSCIVTVGVPVEGISVKPRKAETTVGGTVCFTAKLDPKDATIDGVIWISEDDSICTVDENGVVTAVSAGETRIIAVSEDGHYMSASDVTVG